MVLIPVLFVNLRHIQPPCSLPSPVPALCHLITQTCSPFHWHGAVTHPSGRTPWGCNSVFMLLGSARNRVCSWAGAASLMGEVTGRIHPVWWWLSWLLTGHWQFSWMPGSCYDDDHEEGHAQGARVVFAVSIYYSQQCFRGVHCFLGVGDDNSFFNSFEVFG